jgi:hypothetical protein
MHIMVLCRDCGFGEAEQLQNTGAFLCLSASRGHQLRDEVWFIDMQFARGYAYNRSVFIVHLLDAEDVLPMFKGMK